MSDDVKKCLDGMLDADLALYEKCLDTPGFAFHFNELAKLAGAASRPADDELRQTAEMYADGETDTSDPPRSVAYRAFLAGAAAEVVARSPADDEAARLRAALAPFAAVVIPPNWPADVVLTWRERDSGDGAHIGYLRIGCTGGPTVGDYRRARAALEAK